MHKCSIYVSHLIDTSHACAAHHVDHEQDNHSGMFPSKIDFCNCDKQSNTVISVTTQQDEAQLKDIIDCSSWNVCISSHVNAIRSYQVWDHVDMHTGVVPVKSLQFIVVLDLEWCHKHWDLCDLPCPVLFWKYAWELRQVSLCLCIWQNLQMPSVAFTITSITFTTERLSKYSWLHLGHSFADDSGISSENIEQRYLDD